MSKMMTLTGGKMGGTLQKGGYMEYTVSFSPIGEMGLEGSMLTFTVAGKYVYYLAARGQGVSPAIRFSFMQHDFESCYITSPGATTVIEKAILRISNQDPSANISIGTQ
jgi:hypothetical protein